MAVRTQHLPAIAATPTLHLVAVYSRSLSSAQSLVSAASKHSATSHELDVYSDDQDAERNLDALLARTDVDTVSLALPISLQPAVIEKCLRAGKSVISEKPTTPSVAESKRLIKLYEDEFKPKGLRWIVAEQFPYTASFNKAMEIVRDGKIGELRTFDVDVFIQPTVAAGATNWRREPDYQGRVSRPRLPATSKADDTQQCSGFVLDGGVHFAAGLRHVLPSPISSIFARSYQFQPHLPPIDTLQGLVTLESGISGHFTFCFGVEQPSSKRQYTFRGSKGVLTVDFSARRLHVLRLTTVPPNAEADEPPHELTIELPAEGVDAEFDAFGEALVAGPDSAEMRSVEERSGPRATLRDVAFIEGGLLSAKERREVELKELVGDDFWQI